MKRILIVHENVSTCLSLSDMFGEFGFETGVADTSQRAIRMLNECDRLPDAILLNINMPNMDGWNLREALRTDKRFNKIPIVAMTNESCIVTALEKPEDNFPKASLAYRIVQMMS